MRQGVAHAAGKYTFPSGSGTQFMDGVNAIFNAGFKTVKFYCASSYLTDYPLQTAWSSVPVNLTQLAQTTQYAAAFAKTFERHILTVFTFANGATNWWRVNPTAAAYQAEYTEIYNLVVHLLTTYSGKAFVIQNWEGDWAFMDSFVAETYVAREMVDRYAAFLGTRKRAIEDAVRATASTSQVFFAYEANRVVESRTKPHLRRVLRDIAARVQPHIISYSAYDSTIDTPVGFGADYATWAAYHLPLFARALRLLQLAYPGVPIQIGEFGFPEGPELPVGRDVGTMLTALADVARAAGVVDFIYWQVFDNEFAPMPPALDLITIRGFYTVKPDGTASVAGAAMAALP